MIRCRLHPVAFPVLALVAGVLLWANVRTTHWEESLRLKAPAESGLVMQWFFYRGWPLSPCMVCDFHGLRWHPEKGEGEVVLVIDTGVALLALSFSAWVCERLLRRKKVESSSCGVVRVGYR